MKRKKREPKMNNGVDLTEVIDDLTSTYSIAYRINGGAIFDCLKDFGIDSSYPLYAWFRGTKEEDQEALALCFSVDTNELLIRRLDYITSILIRLTLPKRKRLPQRTIEAAKKPPIPSKFFIGPDDLQIRYRVNKINGKEFAITEHGDIVRFD